MTTWSPPVTDDDRPDPWDVMAAEASKRWIKAHPVRAGVAALVALWRRKQGHGAGVPPVAELVERKPFQSLRARHQWLLHLARLRAEQGWISEID